MAGKRGTVLFPSVMLWEGSILLSPGLSLGLGVFRDFLSLLLQLPHVSIHPASGQQSLVPGPRRKT